LTSDGLPTRSLLLGEFRSLVHGDGHDEHVELFVIPQSPTHRYAWVVILVKPLRELGGLIFRYRAFVLDRDVPLANGPAPLRDGLAAPRGGLIAPREDFAVLEEDDSQSNEQQGGPDSKRAPGSPPGRTCRLPPRFLVTGDQHRSLGRP